MRVSGGELRSRLIPSPPGTAIRPTPGRVKEALFSILGDAIVGAVALDLFAGTGAIGFEALSRGAVSVTFVDAHAATARRIRETAAAFGVGARATVVCATADRAVERLAGRYDFVYADPPYASPPPRAEFAALLARGAIDARSTLVYERRGDSEAFASPGFSTTRDARYGDVMLQFLRVDP